ncbi:uncharacterized protein J8A68_002059 [[Candida] subhashii]|uniref:Uncharacterized protein n=1 Tax=[Candida] subhashii TaxID=561895 RepID=A0A8J5QGT7_9ASCO|nr:uncharacterized protein J8A68_002059 [[Candida] subhashii]KAG7664386.1 hypothetical protein J8A68_002059 [[Candida] subhashii]
MSIQLGISSSFLVLSLAGLASSINLGGFDNELDYLSTKDETTKNTITQSNDYKQVENENKDVTAGQETYDVNRVSIPSVNNNDGSIFIITGSVPVGEILSGPGTTTTQPPTLAASATQIANTQVANTAAPAANPIQSTAPEAINTQAESNGNPDNNGQGGGSFNQWGFTGTQSVWNTQTFNQWGFTGSQSVWEPATASGTRQTGVSNSAATQTGATRTNAAVPVGVFDSKENSWKKKALIAGIVAVSLFLNVN